jgi:hypothetical protein
MHHRVTLAPLTCKRMYSHTLVLARRERASERERERARARERESARARARERARETAREREREHARESERERESDRDRDLIEASRGPLDQVARFREVVVVKRKEGVLLLKLEYSIHNNRFVVLD